MLKLVVHHYLHAYNNDITCHIHIIMYFTFKISVCMFFLRNSSPSIIVTISSVILFSRKNEKGAVTCSSGNII